MRGGAAIRKQEEGREVGQQRRHRIGFVGLGNRGRSHLQTLLRWYADRAVPVAAADPGPQHFTAQPVQAFGWPVEIPPHRCFRDYRDLLALDDVEAVVIATYEAAHLEITLAALDAGKAVLLEKAAVISLAEAETLYRRLISRRPARFQLALNLRHHEVVQTLRRLLAEHAIGRVVAVTAHVNAGHAWGASVFRRFYRDAALSGDLVLSKLTHDADVLHYLLGTYAETVTGVAARTTFVPQPGAGPVCRSCQITATCPSYIDVTATSAAWADHERRQAFGLDPADLCPYTAASTSHDTAMFSGVYANGAVFSLVFTTAGPVYARRYQFNGTGGEIVAVIGGREGDVVIVHALGQAPVHVPVPPAAGGHGGADPRLLGSFLDYLDSESEEPVEPESVLTSVMVPLGGLQAAAAGRAVPVGAWYRAVCACHAGRSASHDPCAPA